MSQPKRICQIVKLKPESIQEYKECHAAVWPGVLSVLEKANIVDYSIFHYPPLQLLIATMKYTGTNYDADMVKISQDPETQKWWAMTDGMQESLVEGASGSGKDIPWWAEVEEVFRFEGKECWNI